MSITSKERPDRSLAAIVLLAALSLVGIIALLPSTEEKAAALLANKKYDQAINLLTAAQDRGELNPYEAFMLVQLYELSGQKGAAVQLLEKQSVAAPDATWPLQQLAEQYRQAGAFEEEARALHQLYALEPNAERFQRLHELYRVLGDRTAEMDLLAGAVDSGLADSADTERLQYLKSGGLDDQSVLWIAPAGHYAVIAQPAPILSAQVFAASGTTIAIAVD